MQQPSLVGASISRVVFDNNALELRLTGWKAWDDGRQLARDTAPHRFHGFRLADTGDGLHALAAPTERSDNSVKGYIHPSALVEEPFAAARTWCWYSVGLQATCSGCR